MDLGVCVATHIGDVDHVVRAEELGYSHAWLADSQMIWSDCYATLALAADRTSRIRIGTGVAVSGTRPAPVESRLDAATPSEPRVIRSLAIRPLTSSGTSRTDSIIDSEYFGCRCTWLRSRSVSWPPPMRICSGTSSMPVSCISPAMPT